MWAPSVSAPGGRDPRLSSALSLHPQSNGLFEWFNRTITIDLAIDTSWHQWNWDKHFPLVLWESRLHMQESMWFMPAVLMFGQELGPSMDLVLGMTPDTHWIWHTVGLCTKLRCQDGDCTLPCKTAANSRLMTLCAKGRHACVLAT